MFTCKPIGIFDSGLGGLSVAEEVFKQLPGIPIVYFGDTARVPYGGRSVAELIAFADEITNFLINEDCEIIIDACNSTSSVALDYLQEKYDNPIIGVIEPVIKSAMGFTSNKRVGLIATEATIKSNAHIKVAKKMGIDIEVFPMACPEFVPLIESGQLCGSIVDEAVKRAIKPLIEKRIDSLILGCTHYPYLAESIKKHLGDDVAIIDPAFYAVKEVKERFFENPIKPLSDIDDKYYVSGDAETFKNLAENLIKIKLPFIKKVIL